MAPTVREILGYEPFRRARARVVVGQEKLDRAVRWVHSSEMPQPARMFQGGELLLTQGRGISEHAPEQRAWARSLAEVNIAGVALETGVVFAAMPESLADAAAEAGLVLIELSTPAYFMDMTEAVHSTIVNAQYGMLQRADAISRRFSRLALEGAGLTQMISELSRAVDHPIVLSDEAHDVVAYAPETPELARAIDDWGAHARIGHGSAPEDTPARTTAAGTTCVWVPIVLRGQLWATVHMLERGRGTDEVDRLALDRAAAAIGLAFTSTSDVERQQQDARSVFVHDLLGGHYADIREIRLQATNFGLTLAGSLRVLVLRPVTGPRRGETRPDDPRHPLRAIAAVTTRIFGPVNRPLIGYDGGQIAAVLPESDATPASVRARAAEVVEECATRHGVPLLIGVSDPVGVADLPRAFADASEVVRYGVRTGKRRTVLTPDDLGIDRLLLELDQGPALGRHIQRELSALLDHDATGAHSLLPTLETYLDHNGNKAETARELNVERRALYYRLDRLAELINGDLEDADTRLRLLVALRGREFRRRARGRWDR